MCSDEEIHGVSALTTEILAVLAAFASEFSQPSWKNIQIILIGARLCRGLRRVFLTVLLQNDRMKLQVATIKHH